MLSDTLSPQQLLLKANALKQNGKFSDAIAILESLLPPQTSPPDFNLISSLCFCYQKTSHMQKIIDLCNPYIQKSTATQQMKISVAWAIYSLHFKNEKNIAPEAAVEHIEHIRMLFPQASGMHPLPLAVFKALASDIIQSPAYKTQLLQMLNPTLLSSEPYKIPNTDKSLPSDLEKYYSQYTKALMDDKQFYKCIELCHKALAIKLSHGQDVWFERRIAMSLAKTGKMQEAYTLFQKVAAKKGEWFILYETALAAFRLNDLTSSELYAIKASQAYGDIDIKIHLWELLKDIFTQTKRFDAALNMLKLIASIKHQKNWSINPSLSQDLNSYHIIVQDLPPFKQIFNEIKKSLLPSDSATPKLIGTISKLLNNNSSGFITAGNKSYYFRAVDFKIDPSQISIGTKVSFSLIDSFDAKKQQQTQRAVKIQKER